MTEEELAEALKDPEYCKRLGSIIDIADRKMSKDQGDLLQALASTKIFPESCD